jgi:hypothetical protein
MTESPRPLIYREWWVFPIMIAIATFPWFMAPGTIGHFDDREQGWLIFAGTFAAAMGGAIAYSVKLHRQGRLFPRTRAESDANRARTLRARSYWPVWVAIALGIRLLPPWLELIGLGVLSGAMVPFTVAVILNAIRVPPTE